MVERVAVTGGVASGKSSLCRFLQDLGAAVISADQIVHHLLVHDPYVHQSIDQLFGQEVFFEGKPSREKLATCVFQKEEKLKALEALLHPLVQNEIERFFTEEAKKNRPLLVAEIPLLFETGMEKRFDVTVSVIAPIETSKEWFGEKSQFDRRAKRQFSPEEKANRSSVVVINKGSLRDLQKEAFLLFGILLELFHHEP